MQRNENIDENGDTLIVRETVSPNSDIGPDEIQERVSSAVEALIEEHQGESHCEVDVVMDGKWCTLEGTVDSQEMRIALFDLVPVMDGKRFIVDRLHVTYEAGSSQEV